MRKINWWLVAVLILLLLGALRQYHLASTGHINLYPSKFPGIGGLGNG